MNKLISTVSLVFIGLLVAFPSLAAEPIFGFQDGKYYDSSQTLKYICFTDNNCYDLQQKFAFKRDPIPIPIPTVVAPLLTPAFDTCPNIDGTQNSEPIGMIRQGDNCVYPSDSSLLCSDQVSLTNQRIFDLKKKFELDKATIPYDQRDTTYVTTLHSLTTNFNADLEKLNLLSKQYQAGLTCKAV